MVEGSYPIKTEKGASTKPMVGMENVLWQVTRIFFHSLFMVMYSPDSNATLKTSQEIICSWKQQLGPVSEEERKTWVFWFRRVKLWSSEQERVPVLDKELVEVPEKARAKNQWVERRKYGGRHRNLTKCQNAWFVCEKEL